MPDAIGQTVTMVFGLANLSEMQFCGSNEGETGRGMELALLKDAKVVESKCRFRGHSNSVAQQFMRARVYCAHPSIRDHRVLSRCPDQVVSLKRSSQCLNPQAKTSYLSTHCSRDKRPSRPCAARE
ncbi:hypothetical protein TNCV_4351641 [Trichonephila clavipes]|nr:hypothetical protein TNCV_4351641 [Trichonephila clavipes]